VGGGLEPFPFSVIAKHFLLYLKVSFSNSSHVPLFQANIDGILFELVELMFCVR
jgi:hypothetical protein